jgi:hypothetical protein
LNLEDVGDDDFEYDPLIELVKVKLYEGNDVGKLSTMFLLLNLKVIHGWSDTSLTVLFK